MNLYFYNFINTYINEYEKTCNTEPGIEQLIHWTTYCHLGHTISNLLTSKA